MVSVTTASLSTILNDKLNVSETLEQARRALAAHREWMERRVGNNFVFPDTHLEEGSLKPIPASWAVGTAPFQPDNGNLGKKILLK